MTDFFEMLGVPRRPWLNADDLKSRFHTVALECHPDRVTTLDPEERAAA